MKSIKKNNNKKRNSINSSIWMHSVLSIELNLWALKQGKRRKKTVAERNNIGRIQDYFNDYVRKLVNSHDI